MLKAVYKRTDLIFRFPAGTSRGILTTKPSWIIKVWNDAQPGIYGLGECPLIPGLNPETPEMLEKMLDQICASPGQFMDNHEALLNLMPSVRFGLETALTDLETGGKRILFPSDFTEGKDRIRINGLIWMGDPEFMKKQVREKIGKGFRCIKIKVGALDFEQELELLKYIRKEFHSGSIEIRLDANGSFDISAAAEKLKQLSEFGIHSVEQPVKPGNHEAMAELCSKKIIPIALDEELIGINGQQARKDLLDEIRPQYIILKPGLLGGFASCREWIRMADDVNTGWWITSALESNIGLNAIAQWTYLRHNPLPQGLGTGALYTNNFDSPLFLSGENLGFNPIVSFDPNPLNL